MEIYQFLLIDILLLINFLTIRSVTPIYKATAARELKEHSKSLVIKLYK